MTLRLPQTIALGVHIGSKGCGRRYMRAAETIEQSIAAQCRCPAGACWVTYARAAHAAGREALSKDPWTRAGAPMPVEPDTR